MKGASSTSSKVNKNWIRKLKTVLNIYYKTRIRDLSSTKSFKSKLDIFDYHVSVIFCCCFDKYEKRHIESPYNTKCHVHHPFQYVYKYIYIYIYKYILWNYIFRWQELENEAWENHKPKRDGIKTSPFSCPRKTT